MVELKAFLANPKHQNRVSQWGEHDCSAYNKKNVDFHEYPSLNHSMDEHWLKGKWWKKSFSCKSEAAISCIPIWRR